MKSSRAKLSRRHVFAGAGTAGALAALAAALPGKPPITETAAAKPTGDGVKTGGYQETPHVLRYYQTARV
jgi:cysteine synthase